MGRCLLKRTGVRRGNDLAEKLPVPQKFYKAGAALFIALAVFCGLLVEAQRFGHLFRSAKGTEIEDAAERVRAIEFNIVGIVLFAFHDPILIGIPRVWLPGEFEGTLHSWPNGL